MTGDKLARAQLTLGDVIALAVQHSPHIKMAEDDVQRAAASVTETRDYYIPSLSIGGGVGRYDGISLSVPTIFTVTSQSLIYSPAQRDYIRGAKDSLRASELALEDARQQVEEDAALTCISLDNAELRKEVLQAQLLFGKQLVEVSERREEAGVDSHLELMRVRRSLLQLEVLEPQLDNEINSLQTHLAVLTGLSKSDLPSAFANMPAETDLPPEPLTSSVESASVLVSKANAAAREEQAHGDGRLVHIPQVLMQSQYGRVSPINDVSSYYNLHGNYNVSEFGVAIQFSIFDRVRAAKVREAAATAQHARHEADQIADQHREDILRLQNSRSELEKKVELAAVDHDISVDELNATIREVNAASSEITGRQLNPKDVLYARINERQRLMDLLSVRLQFQRSQISLMKETGDLTLWIAKLSRTTVDTRVKR